MSEQFITVHWSETGRKRWVNKRHITWFSGPAYGHNDAGAYVHTIGDESVGGTDWLGVKETPEQIIAMLNSSAAVSGPSDCSDSGSDSPGEPEKEPSC